MFELYGLVVYYAHPVNLHSLYALPNHRILEIGANGNEQGVDKGTVNLNDST